jgi:hypothetical protein
MSDSPLAIVPYVLDNVCFIALTEMRDTIHVETEVVYVAALDERRRLITVGHSRVNQREVVCASYSHHR